MAAHNQQSFRWDDARMDELKRRLLDNQSASEISAHFGVSRNVIIGKVYRDASLPRLCGTGRPVAATGPRKSVLAPQNVSLPGGKAAPIPAADTQRRYNDQALAARVRARQNVEAGLIAPPVVGYKPERFQAGFEGQQARVTDIMKLTPHHCRFPLALPKGGLGYCGAEKEEKTSYCPAHAARCLHPQSAAMTRRLKQLSRQEI
jgi:hypothetical protein